MIGPDIYAADTGFALEVMHAYARPDNPLWIPETGRNDEFAKSLFYALGNGAIGFSPFGVDQSGWNSMGDDPVKAHSGNFALLGPMSREIARLNFKGKLKTSVEEPGQVQQELDFGSWQASVNYGFPQHDGRRPPGNKDFHGAALVAQLGPDEFLVTGLDSSVGFHLPGRLPGIRMQILSAEEGSYENGVPEGTASMERRRNRSRASISRIARGGADTLGQVLSLRRRGGAPKGLLTSV
jgi:hypothetical protein